MKPLTTLVLFAAKALLGGFLGALGAALVGWLILTSPAGETIVNVFVKTLVESNVQVDVRLPPDIERALQEFIERNP